MNTTIRIVLFAMMTTGLVACSAKHDDADLDRSIEKIVKKPRGSIDPPPELQSIATYKYDAHHLRSPFSSPRKKSKNESEKKNNVQPDLSRAKEYLESFSLGKLRMKGTINKPSQPMEALVSDPDGELTRVRVGAYMGKNFGEITKIDDTSIELIEIVPDGSDNWVERPNVLLLSE